MGALDEATSHAASAIRDVARAVAQTARSVKTSSPVMMLTGTRTRATPSRTPYGAYARAGRGRWTMREWERCARVVACVAVAVAVTSRGYRAARGDGTAATEARRRHGRKRKEILARMRDATTYDAFEDAALELEREDAEEEARAEAGGRATTRSDAVGKRVEVVRRRVDR